MLVTVLGLYFFLGVKFMYIACFSHQALAFVHYWLCDDEVGLCVANVCGVQQITEREQVTCYDGQLAHLCLSVLLNDAG